MRKFFEQIFYRDRLKSRTLDAFLKPFSRLYGSGAALRFWLYKRGVFKARSLPGPVISIGNLTVGGTGKTPMVIMLAELLLQYGRKPAILSRGYGGGYSENINLVSDCDNILLDAGTAGDEPYMTARKLPGVPVLVGPDRYMLGKFAGESLPVDLYLLDDGFQHLKLKRDVDLVLIDAGLGLGCSLPLPRGPLREPAKHLSRADVIIFTNHDSAVPPPELAAQVSRLAPGARQFTASLEPLRFRSLVGGRKADLQSFKDKEAIAFAGIAQPQNFYKKLNELGIEIIETVSFPDHHRYSKKDLDNISEKLSRCNLAFTTEKDFARLPENLPMSKDIYCLEVSLNIFRQDDFLDTITRLAGIGKSQ
jgi:tetraacyldisaccharide 4'-kinase